MRAGVVIIVTILLVLVSVFVTKHYAFLKQYMRCYRQPHHYIAETSNRFDVYKTTTEHTQLAISDIPLLIHQVYFHPKYQNHELDVELYETCMINRHMNPEYTYHMYNEQDILAYIRDHYPGILPLYQRIVPAAFKADLFRYLVLYREGGVYMDCKTSTIVPLRTFIPSHTSFVCFLDILEGCIQNSFIACSPGHPILRDMIERCCRNISKEYYGINAFDITGPQMCGRAFNAYLGRPELAAIQERHYHDHNVTVLGGLRFVGRDQYEVLCDSDNRALVSRACHKYYHHRTLFDWNSFGVRWFTGRVY